MIKNVWKYVCSIIFTILVGFTFTNTNAYAKTDKVDFGNVTIQESIRRGNGVFGTSLDNNKRPSMMRIILKDSHEEGKRIGNPAIPSNMRSWVRNTKIKDPVKGTQFLWNRGHGIGNQFGGEVTNSGDNIAAETVYLNQVLMLHYEGSTNTPNTLDNWLHSNPEKYLDYAVFFNYATAGDQIPSSVTLAYRGLDKSGKPEFISNIPNDTREGSGKQLKTKYGYTVVTLQNIEPGVKFSYVNGELVGKKGEVHNGWEEKPMDLTKYLGQYQDPKQATAETGQKQTSDTANWFESLGSMKYFIIAAVGIVILGMWLMDEYSR